MAGNAGNTSNKRQKRRRNNNNKSSSDPAATADNKSGGDDAAWKQVPVSLPEPEANVGNHYDDKNKDNDSNNNDLEGLPGEEMGFFFGLEVIPASQYRVEEDVKGDGTKRFMFKDLTSTDEGGNDGGGGDNEKDRKKKRKKKKKKCKDLTEESDEEVIESKRPSIEREKADEEDDKKPGSDSKRMKKKESSSKRKVISQKDDEYDDEDTEKKEGEEDNEVDGDDDDDDDDEEVGGSAGNSSSSIDESAIRSIQMSWLAATGGVTLCEPLCLALEKQKFRTPTPIQSATLAASILGRRNIVGAAPTGSGKTLAFLLPICQYLVEEDGGQQRQDQQPLRALILTPTRELALQIHKECEKLLPGSIGTIVGGLAHAKQTRVLDKKRPPVLVGTPGRLWELISKREHPHLNDLSQIRFLVIDEADRMIRQGSFPQLSRILNAVQRANPMDSDDDDEDEDDDDLDGDEEQEAPDRLFGLPGVPGEARVKMLSDDILQQIKRQQESGGATDPMGPVVREIEDDEYSDLQKDDDEPDTGYDDDEISLPTRPPVVRTTYVYSATLTLPASDSYVKPKKKNNRSRKAVDVDGAIAEILEKSHAKGKTKVVDLTNASSVKGKGKAGGSSSARQEFRLPPGLELKQIKCTQMHKDSHLYAYLMTTEQGASGPCLVFCNSIAAVRRVGATLQALGVEVRILHAHMQQRARFKAVESLKDGKSRKVVVSTDVAARGLDIPSVSSVVHYDIARTVDTFVHRSGRTARGVGEGAVGSSLSLIASGEDKDHARIVDALKVRMETLHLDGRLLNAAQERVNLACKVVAADETERKNQRNKQWFQEKASEAGLDVDDDLLGEDDDDPKHQGRMREAQRARNRLRVLLSEPMQTQRYGKFLSTNSAYGQKTVVQPTSAASTRGGKKRWKRKRR